MRQLLCRSALSGAIAACACACAPLVATNMCGNNPTLLEAGSNVLLAGSSAGLDPASKQRVDNLGGLLHYSIAAVTTSYRDAKVVRLVENPGDPSACHPDVIRYAWSGCSIGRKTPILLEGEPVTVLWTNSLQEGGDVYLQFSLSNWRVGSTYEVAIDLNREQRTEYRLRAVVPISHVSFRPRLVDRELLGKLSGSMQCVIYYSPSFGSANRMLDGCSRFLEAKVLGKSSDNAWLNVELKDSERGWIPLPDRQVVLEIFPEFSLVNLVIGFQQYVQHYDIGSERDYRHVRDAYSEVSSRTGSREDPALMVTADVIMGTVEMLHAIRESKPDLHDAARKHLEAAHRAIPEHTEIANLQLMNDLVACCTERAETPTVGKTIHLVARAAPRFAGDAGMKAGFYRTLLESDPGNRTLVLNVASLLKASANAEVAQPDIDAAQEARRLQAIASARGDDGAPDCKDLEARAQRARKAYPKSGFRWY